MSAEGVEKIGEAKDSSRGQQVHVAFNCVYVLIMVRQIEKETDTTNERF